MVDISEIFDISDKNISPDEIEEKDIEKDDSSEDEKEETKADIVVKKIKALNDAQLDEIEKMIDTFEVPDTEGEDVEPKNVSENMKQPDNKTEEQTIVDIKEKGKDDKNKKDNEKDKNKDEKLDLGGFERFMS